MGLELGNATENGVLKVNLKGRLDSNTASEFEVHLMGQIQGGDHNVLLNFEELDYISSAGLRVLLKAARELKGVEGKLFLCCLKDYIKEVFDLSGFVSFLPIYDTEVTALNKF